MRRPRPELRGSIRNQLVALNIFLLAVLLGGMGVVVRYTVHRFMLDAVDQELDLRVQHVMHPPPHDGPRGGGPRGPFGGPGDSHPADPTDRPPPEGEGPDTHGPGDNGPGGQGGHRDFGRGPEGGPPGDERYGPEPFDLHGTSYAPPNHRHALWDSHGFELAKLRGRVHSTVSSDDGPLQVLSVRFPDHGPVRGVIQTAYPLTGVNLAISGLNRALLMLVPIGLLFAGLGGAFLTDRVLIRVNRVRQAAERIGGGEFSQRLPVIGNDEFSRLSETFNGLLGRLERSFAAQQRLLEQQRRFTADASHELKTPLTIIKGNTSMALSGHADEASYRLSMQEIDVAADTMSHLVQDLLLLARSDGGQLGHNRCELLIRELLQRAVANVMRADAAGIQLRVADEGLTVTGNEVELIRLFTNLLDNAVRYTPPDGQVVVSAARAGAELVVTVADTGVGIAPEHLPHLGERFYRADSSRARHAGGTGLGLSICKGLAEAHGGRLGFQSAPGAGTTVTVTLPAG